MKKDNRNINLLKKHSKKYFKSFVLLILSVFGIVSMTVFLLVMYIGFPNAIPDSILGAVFSVITFLLPITKMLFDEMRNSAPWETYLNLAFKNKELNSKSYIRISYSAFLVIEVDGKYPLVLNSHGLGLYQLPAHVYRLDLDKWNHLKTKFGAMSDDYIHTEYIAYRFLVPAKKIKSFYSHFLNTVNPFNYDYTNLLMDFLKRIDLNPEVFKNADIVFTNRYIKPINYSRYTGHHEMILADKLVLRMNEEQLNEFRRVMANPNEKLRFETLNIIKSNGTDKENNKLRADVATNAYDIISLEDIYNK